MRGTIGIALQAALRSLTGSRKKRRRAGGGTYAPGVPAAVMSAVVAVINGEPSIMRSTPAICFKKLSQDCGHKRLLLAAS